MKHFTHFFTSIRNNIIVFVLFILIWCFFALFFPSYVVPSPLMIFTQLSSYLHPIFLFHLSLTLYRVFTGFFYAFTLGTLLGILASRMHTVQYLNTLMVLLQVLPGTILGIIFLLVFGIGSKVPIALVAFLTLPMISINTSNALSKKSVLLEQYLLSIGGKVTHLIKNIYIPTLIPTFQSNLSIGFGLSLKIVILGEFIGSQDGIGYLLNLSKIYFNMDEVFFYLFTILLIMISFQIVQHLLFTIFFEKYFYPE